MAIILTFPPAFLFSHEIALGDFMTASPRGKRWVLPHQKYFDKLKNRRSKRSGGFADYKNAFIMPPTMDTAATARGMSLRSRNRSRTRAAALPMASTRARTLPEP